METLVTGQKQITVSAVIDVANKNAAPVNHNHILSGFKARRWRFKFRIHLLKLALKTYGWSKTTFKLLKVLVQKRKAVHGNFPILKWAKAGNKYYFALYMPGFKSHQMDEVLLEEMNRVIPSNIAPRPLRFAHFAITKKCPLRCEHCFEWDNINKKEILSYDDLRNVVLKLKTSGISQLHLSGGEPMLRVNDIIELCEEFSNDMEFWIVTSGFNLTYENAVKLKQAGVSGVIVSLDHFDKDKHNKFRQSENAFTDAVNAIKFSRAVDMIVAVSVCTTKAFTTQENLMHYASFVKSLDVSFIQLLEPKAVGHYAGKDVKLGTVQLQLLEDFYFKLNCDKAFQHYPIVAYPGLFQRQSGCFASGNRTLYIDTNGDVLACPFCHIASGNALKDQLPGVITTMKNKGCVDYGLPTV
jgi:MoaA/NifB/PqqE/SkfB family radical SAM enzyme